LVLREEGDEIEIDKSIPDNLSEDGETNEHNPKLEPLTLVK